MKTQTVSPLYKHECNECRFLGILDNKDLYSCTVNNNKTFIIRSGDTGYSYTSVGDDLIPLLPKGDPYRLLNTLDKKRAWDKPRVYITAK